MSIHYNVTGDERKALVKAISEIVGWNSVYKGAPTFAFAVNNYIIDRNGALSYPAEVSRKEADKLVEALKERGFEAQDPEIAGSDDENRLVIQIPREGFTDEAIENLKKIIASKKTLIEKALGLDELPFNENCLAIKVKEDTLCFPWFTLTGTDGEADAYARFICALCEMAKTQKRVTATEKPTENDKFTMRLFLVRLGLKGPENKAVRQIMLSGLSGNSSWKSGKHADAAANADCGGEHTPDGKNTEEV